MVCYHIDNTFWHTVRYLSQSLSFLHKRFVKISNFARPCHPYSMQLNGRSRCPPWLKIFTYSSSNNFLSVIPVSYWSIFCCRNSILLQKKNEKWWKRELFHEKQKNPRKVYVDTSMVDQSRNQKFFRAKEVSESKGTSINI